MSQDSHWADNPIIRATADAVNIEIHIISSTQETPIITFRPITDNPTQTISIMFLLEVCLNRKDCGMKDAQKMELDLLRPT